MFRKIRLPSLHALKSTAPSTLIPRVKAARAHAWNVYQSCPLFNIAQASQLHTCSKITILLAGLLPNPLKGSWHSNHRYSTIALRERFWFWECPWFKEGAVAYEHVLARAVHEVVCVLVAYTTLAQL